MKRALAIVIGFVLLSAQWPVSEAKETNATLPKSVYEECIKQGLEPEIVEAVVRVESIFRNGKPYPYFVCLNERALIKGLPRISGNCYDCISPALCRVFVLKLIKAGITNFDAGSFQWNYRAWVKRGWPQEDYLNTAFSLEEAGKRACRFISRFVRKYGYTANAVALYHSATPRFNYRYAVKVYREYLKLKKRRR